MEEIRENLENIRDTLGNYTNKGNYNRIYNAISDYDYLLDYFYEQDIITSETADEMAQGKDIDSLRCFINDTYADDIYRLDGYGNLDNVTDGDFIYIIDDLIEKLEED